jgi:cold shock protein
MGQRQKPPVARPAERRAGRPFLCECKPLPGVALTRDDPYWPRRLVRHQKAFGFVKVAGLRDTFLHMAVLKEAGYTFVPAGTTLRFTAGKSAGKPRIDEIHSVDTSTAEEGQPDPVRRKRVQADEGGG